MAFPALVLDASAALALCLSEEQSVKLEDLVRRIITENGLIIVPSLFWYEVMNGLIAALRRGRISKEQLAWAEVDFAPLPIATDQMPTPFIRQRVRELSIRHDLTIYDAAYVELADRYNLQLKTYDTHLLALRDRLDFVM